MRSIGSMIHCNTSLPVTFASKPHPMCAPTRNSGGMRSGNLEMIQTYITNPGIQQKLMSFCVVLHGIQFLFDVVCNADNA